MSVVLEGPVRAGGAVVAALVRQEIVPHGPRPGLAVTGFRQPVALLIRTHGATRAFGPDGAALPPEEVERLRPGTLAEIATET